VEAAATAEPSPEVVSTSKVLPRFLAALAQRPDPVLVDLGPVVGSNVGFLGERLACKLFVEDLYATIESHARRPDRAEVPIALHQRLHQLPASVDGILCWDVFDFLDKPTGQALALKLVELLKPGGLLYGFFGMTTVDLSHYTRFVVEAEDTLRLRTYPATPVRRQVLAPRDINKMFDGLVVAESLVLKRGTRETLFRKP
jgi:hypothetical protein